ncbi:hypothetical protein Trydic_g21214 [Trypoxylus dichotomus]
MEQKKKRTAKKGEKNGPKHSRMNTESARICWEVYELFRGGTAVYVFYAGEYYVYNGSEVPLIKNWKVERYGIMEIVFVEG